MLHLLLIGIDAYPGRLALRGCAHDLVLVEGLFREGRVDPEIDPLQVQRLVAPADGEPGPAEARPTLANMRAALAALAGEAVGPDDSVWIYFAGHGARDTRAASHREALVPVDFDTAGLLPDAELNAALRRIAARAGDLTVVLDCCHAGGADRSLAPALQGPEHGLRVRALPPAVVAALPPTAAPLAAEPPATSAPSASAADPEHLFVAACRADQQAAELPGADGRVCGVFTDALVHALRDVGPGATWAQVWPGLRRRLHTRGLAQAPVLRGSASRPVLGGRGPTIDPGFGLEPAGPDRWRLSGGLAAGLAAGARLAVYPSRTLRNPAPASPEDRAARLCTLVVEAASDWDATARSLAPTAALPPDARAVLVRPAPLPARAVQLLPWQPALAARLGQAGLRVQAAAAPGPLGSGLCLRQQPGGGWSLLDDWHGGADGVAAAPLVQLDRLDDAGITRLLLHAARWCAVLDWLDRPIPGGAGLALRVLDGAALSSAALSSAHDYQAPDLPDAPADPSGRARACVRHGAPVAVALRNLSRRPRLVGLLGCTFSGRIELFEAGVVLDPGAWHVVWRGGLLGEPLRFGLPPGRSQGIDRLVAVATGLPELDLQALVQDRSWTQAARPPAVDRSGGAPRDPGPAVQQHEPPPWEAVGCGLLVVR